MTTLGYLRSVREALTPARKESAFLEKGVLTPQEFVTAGDDLVFRCPTWSWESGDPSKAKSYLPADKQYLVTRNVPCATRVSSLEQQMELVGDEGDWMVSQFVKERSLEEEFDILDETGEVVEPPAPAAVEETDEDDEYADMADFEDDNVLQDDAAVVPKATGEDDDDDVFVKVRTYDLSITYDKYYQTPRVWMVGKSHSGQPLSGQEMMQDVMSDYANKTVTIEVHPHVAGPHASIHPCQHGKVMKTIVRNLIKASESIGDGDEAANNGPSIENYLFIFLKFVSSIIPTINYDFTMDVTASTKKE